MALFKPLVGGKERLNNTELHEGYVYFCDDGSLFFDYKDEHGVLQRKQINAKDAETLLGATLVNELTNSELEIPTGAAVMHVLENFTYDDLAEKPFGDEYKEPFYFKGIITECPVFVNGDDSYYQLYTGDMSEFPSYDELDGYLFESNGTVNNANEITVVPDSEIGGDYGIATVYRIYKNETKITDDLALEPGVYFVPWTTAHTDEVEARLYKNSIKKIDLKYLPDEVQQVGLFGITIALPSAEEVEKDIDAACEKLYGPMNVGIGGYKISDDVMAFNDMVGGTIRCTSMDNNVVAEATLISGSNILDYDSMAPGMFPGGYAIMLIDLLGGGGMMCATKDTKIQDQIELTRGIWIDQESIKQLSNLGVAQISLFYVRKLDIACLPIEAQSDWNESDTTSINHIANRPFYETQAIAKEYDGSNHPYLTVNHEKFYCVTYDESIGTVDEAIVLFNAIREMDGGIVSVTTKYTDGTVNIVTKDISELNPVIVDNGILTSEFIITTEQNVVFDGYTVVNPGIYMHGQLDQNEDVAKVYTSKVESKTIKQIDEKFIPDTVARIDDIIQPVQSDWNQNDNTAPDFIKNRICYEETVEGTYTYEFDGDLTGREYIEVEEGAYFVKLSDNAPSKETVIGGTISGTSFSEDYSHIIDDAILSDLVENAPGYQIGNYAMVLLDTHTVQGVMLSKGIWAMYIPDMSVFKSLSYSGTITNVVKIDSKYLYKANMEQYDPEQPDFVHNKPVYDSRIYTSILTDYAITLEDGITTITPSIVSLADFGSYRVLLKNADNTIDVQYEEPSVVYYDGDSRLIGKTELVNIYFGNSNNPFVLGMMETESGDFETIVCFLDEYTGECLTGDFLLSVEGIEGELKQLDEKYIPETIQRVSDVKQSDWSQNDETKSDFIKNRTHYSVTKDEIVTLSFDGNSEGMDILESEDKTIRFVKVSDDTISIDDMRNASVNILTKDGNDSVYDNLNPYIHIIDDKTGSYMVSPFMIVTFGDIVNEGFGKIKKGTWFVLGDNNSHVKSLTYTTEVTEIHKLDPKYLPDGGFGYETTETTIGEVVLPETTLEWKVDDSVANSTNGNYWVPFVPTIDAEYIVTLNGVDYTIKAYEYQGLGVFGNANASSESTTADIPFCGVWGTGDKMMFAIYYDGIEYKEPITIKITEVTNTTVAHKIDPKFLPTGGFGYEDKYEGQLTYTFDGDINNALESVLLESYEDMGYYYVKLSNNTPPIESVIGGSYSFCQEGQVTTLEITEDMIMDASVEGIPGYVVGEFLLVLNEDMTLDGISLSAGMWTMCIYDNTVGGLMYTSELSYYGTDNKVYKIDGKFLYQPDWNQNDKNAPDYIQNRICYTEGKNGTVTIMYDGDMDGKEFALINEQSNGFKRYVVKVSDEVPVMGDCIGGLYAYFNGTEMTEGVIEDSDITDNMFGNAPCYAIDAGVSMGVLVIQNDYNADGVLLTKGVWFVHDVNVDGSNSYVYGVQYESHETVHKLDPKYLPDGGFGYEVDGEILATLELNTQKGSSNYYIGYSDFELIADKTYVITLDSGSYEMTARALEDGAVVIGDLSTASLGYKSDIGFGVLTQPYNGQIIIGAGDCNNGTKMIISEPTVIKQIDPKYIPDVTKSIDHMIGLDYVVLRDIGNGFNYVVQMKDGNLVSRCRYTSINIIKQPNRVAYNAGDYFDPTGMIVSAIGEDGNTYVIDNYIYPTDKLMVDGDVIISFNESGTVLTASVTTTVTPFDEASLVDFEYTKNEDGTYELTTWKGTLNGVTSTECVIPDSGLIIV